MIVLFFISLIIIIFHLFGYPFIIFLIRKLKKQYKKEIPKEIYYPTATMICPAYNEEDEIGEKIDTFLQVNYPKDKIKLIVVSDDSTDKTNKIVKQYAKKYNNIELVVQKPRAGKPSAHNLIEKKIESEVVFLSDATALLKEDSL